MGPSEGAVGKGSEKARVSQLRSLGSVAGPLWWDGVGGGGQLLLKVQEQRPVPQASWTQCPSLELELVEPLRHTWKLEKGWEDWICAFTPSEESGCVPGRPFISSRVSTSHDLTGRASEAGRALGQLRSPPPLLAVAQALCPGLSPLFLASQQ